MTVGHFGDTIAPARATGDHAMSRLLFAALVLLGAFTAAARAQDAPRSECLAMAGAPPRATPVNLRREAKADDVAITYGGHSTYYIDTPGGVRIATDYSGGYRLGRLPDVVTMNRAHSTHYTLFPNPKIPHVLHGWSDDGAPAHHAIRIGDVFIRNVTTDIRRYFGEDFSGEMIKDGNSIFIFEVAGLCIGHLAISITSSMTAILPRSAGSTSSWCRSTAPIRCRFPASPTSPAACAPPSCCRCTASPPRSTNSCA